MKHAVLIVSFIVGMGCLKGDCTGIANLWCTVTNSRYEVVSIYAKPGSPHITSAQADSLISSFEYNLQIVAHLTWDLYDKYFEDSERNYFSESKGICALVTVDHKDLSFDAIDNVTFSTGADVASILDSLDGYDNPYKIHILIVSNNEPVFNGGRVAVSYPSYGVILIKKSTVQGDSGFAASVLMHEFGHLKYDHNSIAQPGPGEYSWPTWEHWHYGEYGIYSEPKEFLFNAMWWMSGGGSDVDARYKNSKYPWDDLPYVSSRPIFNDFGY
ncbi:MAG: hypothetical protein GC154_02520 [bacterium]|nr:hypothetical protein [bacterium]